VTIGLDRFGKRTLKQPHIFQWKKLNRRLFLLINASFGLSDRLDSSVVNKHGGINVGVVATYRNIDRIADDQGCRVGRENIVKNGIVAEALAGHCH
jgi:hypothetical protein